MKNRKKQFVNQLKQDLKKKLTYKEIPNITSLEFINIKVKYIQNTDDFFMEVAVFINKERLIKCKGILKSEYLAGNGILIKNPNLLDRSVNYLELFLARKQCEELYVLVKSFVNSIGDLLDDGYEIDSNSMPCLTICNHSKLMVLDELVKYANVNWHLLNSLDIDFMKVNTKHDDNGLIPAYFYKDHLPKHYEGDVKEYITKLLNDKELFKKRTQKYTRYIRNEGYMVYKFKEIIGETKNYVKLFLEEVRFDFLQPR